MTITRVRTLIFGVLAICLGLSAVPAGAQEGTQTDNLRRRVSRLEREVTALENDVRRAQAENQAAELRVEAMREDFSSEGLVLFLVGCFCALWAQNTGRNPWLWFFLGFCFHLITMLFLLAKNARDRRAGEAAETALA